MAIDTRTPRTSQRWHPAWTVAAVTLGALVAAAAFRSSTGVLIEPIESEFGWTRATTSGAVSLNLVLYGLAAPFAAAVMERFGPRRVVTLSLLLVGLASLATTFMTAPWQLWLLWGFVIGIGTGAMALVFGAIVANRWFHTHRGLVMGVFSAANATGQLIFLPAVGFLIVYLYPLRPEMAVGIMVLAACPGGTTSNLITHMARGNVALSVTLTAISGTVTVFSIPYLVNLALAVFMPAADPEQQVQLPVLETIGTLVLIVLVPTIIGMLIRRRAPDFADRQEKYVRIASGALPPLP